MLGCFAKVEEEDGVIKVNVDTKKCSHSLSLVISHRMLTAAHRAADHFRVVDRTRGFKVQASPRIGRMPALARMDFLREKMRFLF